MTKIAIRINEDEKYPDYSFEQVDSADASIWIHYGDVDGASIIFVGRIFYWLLRLAEKIAEWKDGKLSELSIEAYTEHRRRACFGGRYLTLEEMSTMDREASWEEQFGEEEDRVESIQEFRAKERMGQRVL